PHRPVATRPPMAHALREGLAYARTHPVIWPALALATAVSVFGFPYIVLMPALARDAFGLDATGLGYLMAAVGAGAVLGGLALSAVGDGIGVPAALASGGVVVAVAGAAALVRAPGLVGVVPRAVEA